MDEQTSVTLIRALTAVWSEIRRHHSDVPGVVLLPAPAAGRRVLGHFAALRWSAVRHPGGGYLHEVVVSAEYLNRDPEDVVETLVHEAAHAMNFARGIKDCSKNQYHNRHFKAGAEELGLEVKQMEHYGWAHTIMTDATELRYAEVTASLALVLVHRRSNLAAEAPPSSDGHTANADDMSASRNRKAVCSCGFIIRMSRKTASKTTVRCDACGGAFTFA